MAITTVEEECRASIREGESRMWRLLAMGPVERECREAWALAGYLYGKQIPLYQRPWFIKYPAWEKDYM